MNWNALKLFLAIKNKGTLSGAAKELEINHSTAFRRLNTLEKDIGGRLFERLRLGYKLTAMGEEMLDTAKNISNCFDDLERQVVGKDVQPKGIVKITAPNNITYRYLPRYLAVFRLLYPEIQIELLASNLEFNMNNRQADIAIRATSSPPGHLIGRKLRTIKWSVYSSTAYEQQAGSPQNLDELKNHRLIGAAGGMRSLPGFIWLENKFPQQIHVRSDDMVTMSFLAESGQGLAFLPNDQQRPEIKKLFTFEPAKASFLWILTHPDLRNVKRIKLLMQHLTKAFAEDDDINVYWK